VFLSNTHSIVLALSTLLNIVFIIQQNAIIFGCREVMLRVDAKQGAPRDGNSRIELFQAIQCSFISPLLTLHDSSKNRCRVHTTYVKILIC
jgi:hypothetical protein